MRETVFFTGEAEAGGRPGRGEDRVREAVPRGAVTLPPPAVQTQV